MGTIWLVSLSVFGVSILGARWIKKHLSPIQKLLLLVIFIGLYKYDLNVTSPDYPDWLNIILLGLFALPYGSAFLYFVMEFVVLIADDDKTSKNSRNNRYESDAEFNRIMANLDRESKISTLRTKIHDLDQERGRIITDNVMNFVHVADLSPSELDYNRKRHKYLSKKIEKFEEQLEILENMND